MDKSSNHSVLTGGVATVTVSSWEAFHEEIGRHRANYVWRGQTQDWPLKASFDRRVFIDQRDRLRRLKHNLDNFRAEMSKSFPNVLPQHDLAAWALGQQYGLRTPLLDWTLSPYIAAYFAFVEGDDRHNRNDGYRYVYGLNRSVERLKVKLKRAGQLLSSEPSVSFIDQLPYHNPRFTAQRGVFTQAYQGNDIWKYVQSYAGKRPSKVLVVKIKIPTDDRNKSLRDLHSMNIDHTSLLLDLHNVIDHCNSKS
jgi:hypothetical protein